jgi:hypothetical protein
VGFRVEREEGPSLQTTHPLTRLCTFYLIFILLHLPHLIVQTTQANLGVAWLGLCGPGWSYSSLQLRAIERVPTQCSAALCFLVT